MKEKWVAFTEKHAEIWKFIKFTFTGASTSVLELAVFAFLQYVVFKSMNTTPVTDNAVLHLLRQYDTMIEVFYGGRPYAPADKLNRLAYDYYRIEPIYHPVMAASRVPCTDLEALLAGEEKTEMFNIFFHLDNERRAFIDRATELFPELLCTYSMQSNLEILRRGVDKGSALQKLAEHLGLAPEQVIAVGDSRNDLSMIRYAGTGLAVANACDELKQAANAVACTSDAGVLRYIYHHFVE